MNINIPKSGTQSKSLNKQQHFNTASSSSKLMNHSLNLSSINDKSKSRERQQNHPSSTSVTSKSAQQQQIKLHDRGNSKSNDSLKQRSSSAKKLKKSKKAATSSLNSSKFHSQCTLQQNINNSGGTRKSSNSRSKSKNKKKINLSFQSLQNVGDITANFQSLQNSTRLPQNNKLSQILQPFNTNQGGSSSCGSGHRTNSHGSIINIQTPTSQQNIQGMLSNQNSNLLHLPTQNMYMIATAQGSTDRSSQSSSMGGTDQSKYNAGGGPITAALINPSYSGGTSNHSSSYPSTTTMNILQQQQQQQTQIVNSGSHRVPNFSISQRNSYSPVSRQHLSAQNNDIQHNSNNLLGTNSPTKIMQANPLSFQTTMTPLSQNHGVFLLQKLELFWKERLIKLGQNIQQIKDSAFENDDIIRTMMENQETQDYANQRVIELIKEGIQMDQELQLEQLSKQVVIHQSEAIQISQQRDIVANDFKKLFDDHQNFRRDMDVIINQLNKKKYKYKSRVSQMEEYKHELKLIKDERDNLLEKLKMFQNSNTEKVNYTEQKIEELSRMLQDQEDQKDSLILTLNQMRDDIQKREIMHNQHIQEVNSQVNDKLQQQKKDLKDRYKVKLAQAQEQLQKDLQKKLQDLQQMTETKQNSQSIVDYQQAIEYLQNELANLKIQLEDSVSIKEHETILNAQLTSMRTTHEREIEVIKDVFEKELRKAEKQVRKSVKMEEDKLRMSVCDFERNIDKLRLDKEQFERQTKDEINLKDAQINKLKDLLNDKEKEYQKEINNYKDRLKALELQTQQLDLNRKDELESLKIENAKITLTQTFQLQEAQSQIKQLQKDINDASDQIIMKEQLIKDKESQLQQVQHSFIILETEFNEYQKRQLDKSVRLNDKTDEVNIQNQQILNLKMKLQDQKNQSRWKLEREHERVKRVKQEIELLKKLIQQDIDYALRDQQQTFSQQMQIIIKKYDKMQTKLNQQKDMIHTQDYDKVVSQLTDLQNKYQALQNEKEQLHKEYQNNTHKFDQQVQEFTKQQTSLEEHYSDKIGELNQTILEEQNKFQELYSQVSIYQEETDQLRSENTMLHQKICELDQVLQEMDFKIKNCENERDIVKQQLSFEEKSKADESQNLRQQFQFKQDQLIADFKEQCMNLKQEIEESYQTKLKNKINQLKAKQQDEINELVQKFEQRDSEHNEKLQLQKKEYDQYISQITEELNKIKKEYKKLMNKYKQTQKKDQENITHIEQEVFKSLAKVNSSVKSIGRRQTNMSFMNNSNSASRIIDRTFQNITNHSMFINNPSREQVDLSGFSGKQNLALQSAKHQNNQSYHSLQGQTTQPGYAQHLAYPQSTRSPYPRKQQFQQSYLGINQPNQLGDTQSSTNHSMLLQELNTLTNNNNNNGNNNNVNMSVNLRRISPISKSLNQTDLSMAADTSSFIMVSQSQGVWPPPSRTQNQNQFLGIQDQNQQQQQQQFKNNRPPTNIPPLSQLKYQQQQHQSHLKQQHSSLMQHMKLNEDSSRHPLEMSQEEKIKLREQIDRDKQLLSSNRSSSGRKNRLQESSLNRVLNVSSDLILGSGPNNGLSMNGLQASFMDGSAYKNQQSVSSQIDYDNEESNSNSKPTIANGGILLDSGVGNNDSFLIARSLSPKEKTGKFGNLKPSTGFN